MASFVTTWMEPECNKLMMASINKNYVDMDEYPVTTELQVSFLFAYENKKKVTVKLKVSENGTMIDFNTSRLIIQKISN